MQLKSQRLRKTKDIEAVHGGKSFFTKHFVIKFNPNNLKVSRYTILISNKTAPNATTRNSVRRFIKAIIPNNLLKPGFDFLIIISKASINPTTKKLDKDAVLASLEYAFNKVGLLK